MATNIKIPDIKNVKNPEEFKEEPILFRDDHFLVDNQLWKVEEFKAIKTKYEKKDNRVFRGIITYIYFYCSHYSIYKNMSIYDRKMLIARERLGHKKAVASLDAKPEVLAAIEKYFYLIEPSPAYSLYRGTKEQVDKFVRYVNSIPFSEKNEDRLMNMLSKSNLMLKRIQEAEDMIKEEKKQKNRAGYQERLFENPRASIFQTALKKEEPVAQVEEKAAS